MTEILAELDCMVALELREHARELPGPLRPIPRQAAREADERAGPAAGIDIDPRHAARPLVDVRAGNTQVLCGRQAVAGRHGSIVEVIHAAARFHKERVAPRARVVDAGAVGGVRAGAREILAAAAVNPVYGWIGLLRAQKAEACGDLVA